MMVMMSSSSSSSYLHGEKGHHSIEDFEHDWGRVFRLLFISGVATLASIGNIYTISAIIVDDLLRKKGNSFLVSITLADLLITALVLPASSVAVLGEMEDSENICRFQYGMGSMSCLTAAMFTAAIGVENFLRLKALRHMENNRERKQQEQESLAHAHARAQAQARAHHAHTHAHHNHSYPHSHQQQQQQQQLQHLPSTSYQPPPMILTTTINNETHTSNSICTVLQVTILNLKVWLLSGVIVLIHFVFMPQLMYALCSKTHPGSPHLTDENLLESTAVFGICTIAFVFLGGLGFLKCIFILRSWRKPKPYLTSRELALVSSNCWNWGVRFLIWLPSVLAAVITQSLKSSEIHRSEFHMSTSSTSPLMTDYLTFQRLIVWPAILPSCLSSFVNLLSNKDFRRCYVQFFHYCCCKTSVALTRRPREQSRGGTSDVRVHIIPGYNIYSSSTGHCNETPPTPPRFSNFKCGPLMHCKRDIYEL